MADEAEILGKPQRIEELAVSQIEGEALEIIRQLHGSIGITTGAALPGYFLTMIKHPEIFRCHLAMGTAIFKGDLPARQRELAVLRIAWLKQAPYEWGEHVDIALRYGASADEVERVTLGSSAPGWSAHDAAMLRAVEEMLSDAYVSDATWDALAAAWSEKQLIEFLMMVGQYAATAMLQNSLRMRLAHDNPGMTYRGDGMQRRDALYDGTSSSDVR